MKGNVYLLFELIIEQGYLISDAIMWNSLGRMDHGELLGLIITS